MDEFGVQKEGFLNKDALVAPKLNNLYSPKSIDTVDKFKRMYREIAQGVQKCRDTCDYFDVCGGGSPSNKYYENGTFDSTETQFCIASRKVIAQEILSTNERLFASKEIPGFKSQ